MKNKMKWLLVYLLTLPFAIPAYAQVAGVSSGSGSCNLGNAENIGQHIIDWLLCGASFTNPQSTLFGALSLVINVAALTISVGMFIWNSTKWLYFTTQYGVPGGNSGGKIHGGIVVLRTGMLLSLLAPIVGNGFSPIQVAMKSFTEIGKDIGDMAANTTANYVAVSGAIVNADLQNIEAITAQIIASEMCAKLFDAHHQMDIANGIIAPGTRSVVPIASASGSNILIQWTYKNPTGGSRFRTVRTLNNMSNDGICGSITVNIPKQLTNNGDTSFDVDPTGPNLYVSTLPHLQPYGDVLSRQYAAIQNHIQRVSTILESTASDAEIAVGLAAAKARQDSSLRSAIDAAHVNELSMAETIESNIPNYIENLKAANAAYFESIRSIGINAASTINLTDNVVSPNCGAMAEDLSSALDQQNTSIAVCNSGESWQEQLERQGFIGLGLYYIVHLKLNEKILDLQSHLAEPENRIPFYEDYNNFVVDGVFKEIAGSETSNVIYSRYEKILRGFMNSVTSNTFRMNFSAAENVGDTALNDDAHRWYQPKSVTQTSYDSITMQLNRVFIDALVSQSNGGDLILKLMLLGSKLLGIAHILFGLGAIVAGVSFFNHWRTVKKVAKSGVDQVDSKPSPADGSGSDFSSSKLIFYIALFCFVAGGLLFFGLPAVPLFKWVLEVQSWAIMMFMAFIYAPLWIMAHASITDDRFMAEHTQSGYGMVYELLLRPLLMVIAFYAMIKLMHIADIGLTMMSSYLMGIGTTGFTGFGVIFIMIITLFTAFHLTMRCFDLISLLPDYVISRIGFGTKPLGDVANDGSHKNLILMASRSSAGAVKSAGGEIMNSVAGRMGLTAKSNVSGISDLNTPPSKS